MPASSSPPLVAFSDLRTAAYCPRKCYYARRDDREYDPQETVSTVRSLAFRYPDLLEASTSDLADEPIEVEPETYHKRLANARDRLEDEEWRALCEPANQNAFLSGRDCRGIVHKVLTPEDGLPAPSLLSTGEPPDCGVWEPQSVHAVATAKALAWDRQTPIEVAYLEYPAYGEVRRLELTTRRKALYRRALRTVRGMDGPPARVKNRSKCESCEYADECGVRTRTLRSLLGRG